MYCFGQLKFISFFFFINCTGFSLRYRKEHDIWQDVILGKTNRTYTAAGLWCGTSYKFAIFALNSVGKSESSNIIEAKTNGSGKFKV